MTVLELERDPLLALADQMDEIPPECRGVVWGISFIRITDLKLTTKNIAEWGGGLDKSVVVERLEQLTQLGLVVCDERGPRVTLPGVV